MSYVAHKSRLFRDAGDLPDVVRKRSEGRIKTYPSQVDARAWGVDGEDRRQHILDLIKADHEKCTVGKYVPIDVLIETLMANKNADIEKLREQVEELQALLDMYLKLDLTEDQKRMLAGMKKEMNKAKGELDGLAERSASKSTSVSPRQGKSLSPREEIEQTPDDTEVTDSDVEGAPTADTMDTSDAPEITLDDLDAAGVCDEQPVCGAQPISVAENLDNLDEKQLKALCISKNAEIATLKDALDQKQNECEQQYKIAKSAIEELETLKDIMEERNTLKKQLEDSLHQLKTLKSRVEDPCVQEIAALEVEIDRLRENGQLSPDEEAEVIRKEVEVLKKYCAKLSNIQEENNKLKSQMQRLQELSGIPSDYDDSSQDSNDPEELKSKLKDLRMKFGKLTEIMDERDRFKTRIKQLEGELTKYTNLPEEIEMFKQRSEMLDNIMTERDDLVNRLDNVKGMDEELKMLKIKAARADELERQLNAMGCEMGNVRRNSVLEMQQAQTQNNQSAMELDNLRGERDKLRMKAADAASMSQELERARCKAQEADCLRVERDRLKARLDELAGIECQYKQLLDKVCCFEAIKAEREMYKQKYEELLGLECECDMLRAQVERFKQLDRERDALLRQVRDCECCIADQEDEIKRLICHIDSSSQGSNKQQERMQKAMSDMRAELDHKSALIAASEEQLEGVQDQLKRTIAGVTCEATCLRSRIVELETEVGTSKSLLNEKDGIINSLHNERQSQEDAISQLQNENERLSAQNVYQPQPTGIESDEHLQAMLQQSKDAIEMVADELEEWDSEQEKPPEKTKGSDDNQDLLEKLNNEKRSSLQLTNDVQALQEQIRELKEQLDKANATIAGLRDELSGNDRLTAENSALRRHSTEVQDVAKEQIEELVADLKKAKDEIVELQSQIENLEMEKNKLKKLLEQMQEDQSSGGVDVNTLRMQLADLEEQLAKETKLRQVSEDRVACLNKQLNNMSDTMQEKTRRSSINETDLQSELLKLRAENQQLKDNVKVVGDSAARRTSQVEGEVEVIAEQNKQLLKEKIALESENASLMQQLADLKQQLENMKSPGGDTSELDALRQEKQALLAQIEDQKKQISDLLDKVGGASSKDLDNEQLEKERREKEELQNLVANLQGQLNNVAGSAADDSALLLQEQLEKERKAREDLQKVVDNLQGGKQVDNSDAIAQLTRQLEEEQAKAAAAETSLKKLQADAGTATTGSDDSSKLQNALDMANAKINELQAENLQLASAAAGDDTVLFQQISDLKQKINELEAENMELKSKLSRRQTEIGALRRISQDAEKDHIEEIDRLSKTYTDKIRKSSVSLKVLEQALNLNAEDQEAVDKMKAAYEERIRGLQDKLALKEKECTETIATLKEKYERDVKNVSNKFQDGIAKLQGSHEEILKDVGKEYEKEVENLRSELRSSKGTIKDMESERNSKGTAITKDEATSLTMKTMENVDIKPKSKGVCPCGAELDKILQKILKDGLQSLKFEELQYLHTKTCSATAAALNQPPMLPMPPAAMPMRIDPMDHNQYNAIPRGGEYQNDFAAKQKHAQQKVGALQIAVRLEKERLKELKNTLDMEKQRNCELMFKIGAQSRAVANMQVEREMLRKKSSAHEEKLQEMTVNCDTERSRVRLLECDLQQAKQQHKRASDALECTRVKLEKSLANEVLLKMQLEQRSPGRPKVPCPCHRLPKTERSTQPPTGQNSSFYTEFSVQDMRKKRNFVHHCCTRHRDPAAGNDPNRRCLSAQVYQKKQIDE